MIKPKFLGKNQLIMKELIATATHPTNNRQVAICTTLNVMHIVVSYDGKMVSWSLEEMVKASVDMIDKQESK